VDNFVTDTNATQDVPIPPLGPSGTCARGGEHLTDRSVGGQDSPAAPSGSRLDDSDPMLFVRQFLARERLEVLFDNSVFQSGRPLKAVIPDDVDAVLAVAPLELSDVVDQMLIECKREGYDLRKGDIDRATRQVFRLATQQRLSTVIRPLILPRLSEQDQAKGEEQWQRVGALFDMDQALAIAILQHFIWQVFQKIRRLPVLHHLMPVVVSNVQGSGKTTFVTTFLAPLRELATGPALLTDIADRRSVDIFRYPVVNVDDVEQIDPAQVPVLKSLLTAQHIRRRRLGTSTSVGIRQQATPIGTANKPIQALIKDDTGHRRFANLPFRNGSVAQGGDPEVWQIVSSSDYELLWRSVDAFAPSPILKHLDDLVRHQGRSASKDPVLQWLQSLDLNSEPVLRITKRPGVQAQALHSLYLAQTGAQISSWHFAEAMSRYFSDPGVPFGDKIKTDAGAFYRFKART
jgi:hypothetical protein